MNFCPERLIQLRTSLNINKAEAARQLNISAMAYGRYERGEREPSYQSACFIAQTFHCNVDFLYGISDQMEADQIIISRSESPELYELVQTMQTDQELRSRIFTYVRELSYKKLRNCPVNRTVPLIYFSYIGKISIINIENNSLLLPDLFPVTSPFL